MPTKNETPLATPSDDATSVTVTHEQASPDERTITPGHNGRAPSDAEIDATRVQRRVSTTRRRKGRPVDPGITTRVPSVVLREAIRLRALGLLQRFRVIRAIDVAVACFPDRPFKAALTAAQRGMRGMAKAQLVRRYRTDRFQHVYALTAKGATWLEERGLTASSSVRRVSDMTNPEHRLWAQFLVLACEARALRALTESELLQELNRTRPSDSPLVQGLLTVQVPKGQRSEPRLLRPDAMAFEPDGCTWFEVDRSKRGADREASLRALAQAVGARLANGQVLRTLVVFARTGRVHHRVVALLEQLSNATTGQVLIESRVQVRHVERTQEDDPCGADVFEVWTAVQTAAGKRRSCLVDALAGHVIVQRLPAWLPKVRLDARNRHSTAGWFTDNFLPYLRPAGLSPWRRPTSPLVAGGTDATEVSRLRLSIDTPTTSATATSGSEYQ